MPPPITWYPQRQQHPSWFYHWSGLQRFVISNYFEHHHLNMHLSLQIMYLMQLLPPHHPRWWLCTCTSVSWTRAYFSHQLLVRRTWVLPVSHPWMRPRSAGLALSAVPLLLLRSAWTISIISNLRYLCRDRFQLFFHLVRISLFKTI